MTNTTKHTPGLHVHKDGSLVGHPFTVAGLGNAPFSFIGMRENVFNNGDGTTKGGGMCAYCGTGIRNEFVVRSACGKQFVVGCDCIRKVNDTRLIAAIASAERLHKRKLAADRKIKKENEARVEITALESEFNDALLNLQSLPHPNSYFASQGKTAADYYRFFFNPQYRPLQTLEHIRNAIAHARAAIAKAKGE